MKTKNMTIPNWCGKFVSALAVLSVSMFGTSCNDEELVDNNRKPLQLSVTANAPLVSRAIINDTYLPDGSQIGVTLMATDGSAYDNQDFYNLAYTASGTGAEQVWSSATPASLSTTSGKVIAYYPYNGSEELDLTAIPVETASQTDYMYAKPVTGIDFTSADINLNMQHAMTDIRINLKKGTYTGTGEVTKVTAKAAAFATSATMDAETGVFANVSGSGEQFVQEFTDLTLTTTAYSQDFLMVPDTKSTSGEVSILTIIDGKKFAVTVPYTESFQQGYSYVYNLTLDNSGLVLEGVDVTKWSVKVKEEQELEFYDNQYIVEIQVPSDGYSYRHNIEDFVGSIDWGDGTVDTYVKTTTFPTHHYAIAGNYIVTAKGKIDKIKSYDSSKIITKLVWIGKDLGVSNMRYAFYGQTLLSEIMPGALDGCTKVTNFANLFKNCENLASIPVGLFDKCTEATSFGEAFYYCSNLTEIPEGLFDKCTKVTTFTDGYADRGCFSGCSSLQAIPSGLFDNCPKVTNFGSIFSYTAITEIPEGLFDKCTEVISFYGAFNGCKSLQTIPSGLFDNNTKVKDFNHAFSYCIDLQYIPEGLFDNCTEVTRFSNTFYECDALQVIPEGLFDKCTEVTEFKSTFERCNNLQAIPSGLFDYNTKVTDFSRTFAGDVAPNNNRAIYKTIPENLFDNCPEVTSFNQTFANSDIINIPKGLFDNNSKVTTFYGTFYGCSGLTSIPNGLFDNCPEVTTFEKTFSGMWYNKDYYMSFTTIPEGLFDYNTKVTTFFETFYRCNVITNLPKGLFDNCTEVTNFSGTFAECTSLQSIPEGLFDKNTKVTSFEGAFEVCEKLQAIPEGLFDKCTEVTSFMSTFEGCKSLTSIPEGLFDNCTEVTSFKEMFYGCTSLQTIPSGLFDKNIKVTSFGSTFYGCKSLTGESPYTIIQVDGVDTKVHLYERTNHPSYFTKPTTYSGCFEACTGLTDYSSIPSSWL